MISDTSDAQFLQDDVRRPETLPEFQRSQTLVSSKTGQTIHGRDRINHEELANALLHVDSDAIDEHGRSLTRPRKNLETPLDPGFSSLEGLKRSRVAAVGAQSVEMGTYPPDLAHRLAQDGNPALPYQHWVVKIKNLERNRAKNTNEESRSATRNGVFLPKLIILTSSQV